jgi:hypothetical protein
MMVAAIARAQGNVLHAVMLHDALRDLPTEQRRADRIPRGFKELIGDVWDRAASHAAMRAGLGLLCAAQQARSLDILAELAGWSYDDKQCARAQSPSDVVNAGAKLLGNGRTTSSIPRSDRSSKQLVIGARAGIWSRRRGAASARSWPPPSCWFRQPSFFPWSFFFLDCIWMLQYHKQ